MSSKTWKKIWRRIEDVFKAWVRENIVADEPADVIPDPEEEIGEKIAAETAAEIEESESIHSAPKEGPDAVPFADLPFDWGGFSGKSAAIGSGRIGGLSVSSDGMSYSTEASWWKELGCPSYDEAKAIACLFCRISGAWHGGKFDWLSESRKTRDFKNISVEGYHGWDKNAIGKADAFAFVIVSENGKSRTNVCAKGV